MAADRRRIVAVTGATGFIGRRLLPRLHAAGWRPRILVRRDPAALDWGGVDVEVVQGDLADADALQALVTGTDAVLHLAGLIKAARDADFFRANRDGTRRLARAVDRVPGLSLLLVSSLAAREPELSAYAASKRAAEEVALEILGPARLTVLRPSAVYGPGDPETLAFFQLARLAWLPLLNGPEARNALIHVDDLAAALVGLLDRSPTGVIHAISDGCPDGYSFSQIMAAAAAAQNLKPRGQWRVPASALGLIARVGDAGRRLGRANMLHSAKLRELLHPDWSLRADETLALDGWQPHFGLDEGFAATVIDYRRRGWLP